LAEFSELYCTVV